MEEKKKDSGMKWVIVADVMIAVVVFLLVLASYIERGAKKNEALKEIENQKSEEEIVELKSYDFDLKLKDENCDGVKGNVDVVLITDKRYVDFTRVAMKSAIETKCPDSRYNFHIMTMELNDADKEKLKEFESDEIKVSLLEQKEIDLFYIRGTHVSKTSLLKYYIPEVLGGLDKVLYIDADVLILHDLTKLFDTDVNDVYLAAVKDPSWFFENNHVVDLGLEKRGFYFNSGVMLMNLDKMRKDGLIEKLEEYTNNNYRTYMDQDALNVLVGESVKLLDVENNTMNFFFEHNSIKVLGEFYGRNWTDYEDVFSRAVILHFASSKKPMGTVVKKDEFFYMLQKLWYKYYRELKK